MSVYSSFKVDVTKVAFNRYLPTYKRASLVAQMVKNLPAMQTLGSLPGSGRSPGEGNDNPLQYSCLENSVDRAGPGSPWGQKESDTTEQLTLSLSYTCKNEMSYQAKRHGKTFNAHC